MTTKRKLLTNLLETAECLGVPAAWLKDAAFSGVIPCLFVGKRQMLFDPDAVEESMASLARRTSVRLLSGDAVKGENSEPNLRGSDDGE